jgi:hypothetical protein
LRKGAFLDRHGNLHTRMVRQVDRSIDPNTRAEFAVLKVRLVCHVEKASQTGFNHDTKHVARAVKFNNRSGHPPSYVIVVHP